MDMTDTEEETCRCGSGLQTHELYDARGIYCGLCCDKCEEKERSKYRSEIFNDPEYVCDEQIDDDY